MFCKITRWANGLNWQPIFISLALKTDFNKEKRYDPVSKFWVYNRDFFRVECILRTNPPIFSLHLTKMGLFAGEKTMMTMLGLPSRANLYQVAGNRASRLYKQELKEMWHMGARSIGLIRLTKTGTLHNQNKRKMGQNTSFSVN